MSNNMKFIMENWKRKIHESNAPSFLPENDEINDSTDLFSLDVSNIKDEDLKAALELFEEEMRQLAYEIQLAKRAKDGEQDAEDARADRAALRPKIKEIKTRLQQIANAANATETPKDDKAVVDKVEDAVQKVNSIEGETASNDEIESELQPVVQDLDNAAAIVKKAGEEQGSETTSGDQDDEGLSDKVLEISEKASSYLSYASIGTAGLAVASTAGVATAPAAIPLAAASVATSWASTAADAIALAAAHIADDEQAKARNAAAFGTGLVFSAMGAKGGLEIIKQATKGLGKEVAKGTAKETLKSLGKEVAKDMTEEAAKEALEATVKEITSKQLASTFSSGKASSTAASFAEKAIESGEVEINGETYTKEQLQKIGETIAEKTKNKIESATEKEVKASIEKAKNDPSFSELMGQKVTSTIDSIFGSIRGLVSGDEEQPQERQTVTLDNNTPKLQQLANAFVQLSDEQYDQLRGVLDDELEKARVENYNWQDLPQGLQNFENSALFMFSPEGSGYTLKPEVINIVPIKNEDGEDVTFEITQDEFEKQYEDNQENMKEIGDKLEQEGEQEMTDELQQKINAAAQKMKDEGEPDLFKGLDYEPAIEVLRNLGFVNLPEDLSNLGDNDELRKVEQTVDTLKTEIEKAYEALEGDGSTTDSGEQDSEAAEKEANKIYGEIAKKMQGILSNPKFGSQQVKDVKITQFFNALKEKDFEKYKIAVGKSKVKQKVFDRLADIVEKFPPSSTKNGSAVQDLLDQANQRLGTQSQSGEPEETEEDFPEGTPQEIQNSVLQIFEKVKDQIEEETHVPTKRALAKFLGLYLEASKEPETITENNMELALDMNDAFVRAYRVLNSEEQELVSTAFNKLDSKAFNEKFKLVDADLAPEDEEGEEASDLDALLQKDGKEFILALTQFYRDNKLIDNKGVKASLVTILDAFQSLPDEASEPTPEPEETEVDTNTDTTPIVESEEEEVESLPESLLEGIYLINEEEEQSEVGKAIATLTDVEEIPDTIIPFERVGELRDKLKSILKVKDEQVKSPDAAELTSEEIEAIMQGSTGKELMRVFIDTVKEKFNGKLPPEIGQLMKVMLDRKPGGLESLFDSTMLIIDPLDANELKKKIAKFYPPDEELDSALSAGLDSSQKKILKAIKAIFAAREIVKIDGGKARALPTDFQTRFIKAIPSIRRYKKEVMKALAISFSDEVGSGVFAESNMNEFVDAAGKALRGFQKKYMGQKRHEESRGLQDIMASVMDEMEFMRRRGAIFRTFKTPEFRSFYGDLRDLLMNIMQNPEEIKIDDETMEVIIDADDLDLDDDGEQTTIDQEIDEADNIDDDEKENLKKDVEESRSWINSLPPDERSSVEIFVSRMAAAGAEILPPTEDELQNVDEAMTDYHRNKIDQFKKEAGDVFPSEFASAMEKVMEELQDADRDRVANLMYTEQKRFINYLTTIFTIKLKLDIEAVEVVEKVGLLKQAAAKVADVAKDMAKPIKDLYDQIKPEIQNKLRPLVNDLAAIKNATNYVTGIAVEHFWEMLTTFFKKNQKIIKSEKPSDFKKALEEAENSDELSNEKKQEIQRIKGRLIDSYDKVTFPTKKLMDSLPGKLGTNFALFAIQLIELVEKIMKLVKVPSLRVVALALFLKFASPDKFANLEKKSMDDLGIKSNELLAVAPTRKNDNKIVLNNPGDRATLNIGSSPERTTNMDYYPGNPDRLGEALKPIIERMLKEHYIGV